MRAANPPADIFADELNPVSNQLHVTYRVAMPGDYKYDYWANVSVEESGYCELHGWKWGELRQPRPAAYNKENWHLLEAEQEVWGWLKEWELVELKAIGPEDSEYFATDKLTGTSNDSG